MGPVFRAYDAERERLVAVKLFKLDLPPERVHQLVAALEQLIAADLMHPAMAVPLAAGITGVSAYLAQDYVAAESLDLAVREYGPAPPADALRVAAQLAGALDFGAVVNVNHGALHPRDILLSADETRLTGLGVARALERIGVPAPVRRPYTAPERMAGGEWGRRADAFSLAALVHELLWGRRITGSGSHVADGLTDIPGGRLTTLKDVFARALAEDPNDRYDKALEFAEALKGAFPTVALIETPLAQQPEEATVDSRQTVDQRREQSTVGRRQVVDQRREPLTVDSRQPTAHVIQELQLPLDEEPKRESIDFDLRAVDSKSEERQPYRDIEPAASASAVLPADTIAPDDFDRLTASPPLDIARSGPEHVHVGGPPVSMIEQSRSAVWPLMAALAIGLGIGFAGGYGVGTHEQSTVLPIAATPPPAPPIIPAPSAGRESTEVAVAETPRSEPPPVAVAPPEVPAARPSRRATPPPRTISPPTRPSPRPAPESSGTSGRFIGGLSVESKPTGARVFLDGRVIGTTPLSVASVPAGSHAIRIELAGYRRWSSSVRVVAAEQNRVTASLER